MSTIAALTPSERAERKRESWAAHIARVEDGTAAREWQALWEARYAACWVVEGGRYYLRVVAR